MAGDIAYLISMPDPQSHLFEVELLISDLDGPTEFVMPSWTPGSYLMREFARHIQDFAAEAVDGTPQSWRKTDKNTWRVDARPGGTVRISYRVYANEASVRTSHLDSTHAYVNGTSVFMFVRGRTDSVHRLEVDAPREWKVTTSMEPDGPDRFSAANYDELVDSPLEIGNHELLEWEQHGVPHRYAIWGRGNYDAEKLVDDTRRIIDAERALFGSLPYPRYTFILHLLPDGRGGLEHASSCSLQADRWMFEGDRYQDFLELVAHEFFHVWNAKRIRPAPLGPFDYTAENYTRNLWVVEGLTTYYAPLILRRAGLVSVEKYLDKLGTAISRMQALPGRRRQSLAESSFDTWIRFYRPDENTPNSQISYYHKGALVGMLLDLEIRWASDNQRSLDDLMRLLWERYGAKDIGYPEVGDGSVEALAEEVAGTSLSDFFDAYVRGTDDLDYERYLSIAGLYLRSGAGAAARSGETPPAAATPPSDAEELEARLGIRTRERAGKLEVAAVLAGSAGWGAGLDARDEIIALNGFRVTAAADIAARLRGKPEGEMIAVAVFRHEELLRLTVPLGAPPMPRVQIAKMAEVSAAQRSVLGGWVGP